MACVAEMAFYAVVKDELTDEVDGAMGLEAFSRQQRHSHHGFLDGLERR